MALSLVAGAEHRSSGLDRRSLVVCHPASMNQGVGAWLNHLVGFTVLPIGFLFDLQILRSGQQTGRSVGPLAQGFRGASAIVAELFPRLPTRLWGEEQGRDGTNCSPGQKDGHG